MHNPGQKKPILLKVFQMVITRRKAICMIGGVAAAGLLGYSGCIEPSEITVTRTAIPRNPAGTTRKLRFVQLTDLHLRNVSNFHKSIARITTALKPDILFFTGDSFHNANAIDLLDKFLSFFPKQLDKFSVLGNWEHWSYADIGQIRKIYSRHNCRLLVNETVNYSVGDKKLLITGLDDYTGGIPDLHFALKNQTPTLNHLLLCHSPGYVDRIAEEKNRPPPPLAGTRPVSIGDFSFTLMLSGHTHGGQVAFFGFTPVLPENCGRYVHGLYSDVNPPVFVSRGIGTSTLPVRFMAPPEIAYFEMALC
jgi:uncharacterized protein